VLPNPHCTYRRSVMHKFMDTQKDISEELELIAKEITKDASENYERIRYIFKNEYVLPEIDPLRNEICICIVFSLYQAAITLTNHLLEKYLKVALIYSDTKDKIKPENVETIFKTSVDNYSSEGLNSTINACCSKGIITKDQKKDLLRFKDTIRDPFSHADMKKIFNEITINTQIGKIDYADKENLFKVERAVEVNLTSLLPVQGIAQVQKPDNLTTLRRTKLTTSKLVLSKRVFSC